MVVFAGKRCRSFTRQVRTSLCPARSCSTKTRRPCGSGWPHCRVSPESDILGLGCTAVDEFLFVAAYPPADGKARVQRRERHCGGLTAAALIAAARLGGKCAFAGVLGEDELSRFVLECLKREKVHITHVVRRRDARPIQSTVVVDERRKTRAIFFDTHNVRGADPIAPTEEVIRS